MVFFPEHRDRLQEASKGESAHVLPGKRFLGPEGKKNQLFPDPKFFISPLP
jgi:hypothetical protein